MLFRFISCNFSKNIILTFIFVLQLLSLELYDKNHKIQKNFKNFSEIFLIMCFFYCLTPIFVVFFLLCLLDPYILFNYYLVKNHF
jgi:hypothetical protein